MAHLNNPIVVLSANCQGIRNSSKRLDVIKYLQDMNAQIICLQDTHLTEADNEKFRNIWDGTFYLHGQSTNSRGVAVLFNDTFEYQVMSSSKDTEGNYLQLSIKMFDLEVNLMTIYGPNVDNPNFFENIENLIMQSNADYHIVCGDFNLVLDPTIDTNNYKNINNPRSRQKVLEIVNNLSSGPFSDQLLKLAENLSESLGSALEKLAHDIWDGPAGAHVLCTREVFFQKAKLLLRLPDATLQQSTNRLQTECSVTQSLPAGRVESRGIVL